MSRRPSPDSASRTSPVPMDRMAQATSRTLRRRALMRTYAKVFPTGNSSIFPRQPRASRGHHVGTIGPASCRPGSSAVRRDHGPLSLTIARRRLMPTSSRAQNGSTRLESSYFPTSFIADFRHGSDRRRKSYETFDRGACIGEQGCAIPGRRPAVGAHRRSAASSPCIGGDQQTMMSSNSSALTRTIGAHLSVFIASGLSHAR